MPTVNGVGSGLDIEALIQASLIYRKSSIRRLQAKQALASAQQGAVLGLKSKVSAFQSAAADIKDLSTSLMIAFNEGEGLLLSASADATPGSHDVVVHTLAQAHRIAAAGVADRNSTAIASGSGDFSIRVGDGATLTVEVDATTTLEDLVEKINEESSTVTASIVNDGSKATSYRMVLTSSQTGADNVIAITENETTLNFATNSYEQPYAYETNSVSYTGTVSVEGTFSADKSAAYLIEILTPGAQGVATYQVSLDGGVTWDDNGGAGYATEESPAAQLGGANTNNGLNIAFTDSGTLATGDRFELDAFHPTLKDARDAFIEVDGIAVRSTSNSVEDALQGVTFDLKEADATEIQNVTIRRQDGNVSSKVGTFVTAYNDLIGGIRSQQQYDPEKKQAGSLLGDQVANRIVHDISRAISQSVKGVTGSFSNLAEIGLMLSAKGVLSLNSSELKEAIEADTLSVVEVLQGATTSSTTDLEAVSVPNSAPADSYSVDISQAPAQASFTASAAMAGPLSANEVLYFTYASDATAATPTSKIFQATLTSGSSLAQVISFLNDEFKSQGTDLIASDESGALFIQTTEYGSDMKFTVSSDQVAGAGTSQVGTSLTTAQGVDIEGTVGGHSASGLGSILEVEYGDLDSMRVKYTGSATGVVGSLAVVQGSASNFVSIAASLMDEDHGALTARDKALQSEIDSIQSRIDDRNRLLLLAEIRARKRYVALDVSLGKLKLQGDAMISQLQMMLGQATSG